MSQTAQKPQKPRTNRRIKKRKPPEEEAKPRLTLRERLTQLPARLLALRTTATSGLRGLHGPAQAILRALSLVAMVGLFLAVGRLGERHLHTARFFATREIAIAGNAQLSNAQVMDIMGVHPGQNVFEVSGDAAQKRLERHPWIASAAVERRLPGSYRVELRERKAMALISLDQLYLVSETHGVFKPLEVGDPVDLPVITGVDPETFASDLDFRTRVLVHVVQFLHDYRDAGLWRREPVQEIHMAADEAFSVYVGDDALHVRVGAPPFRKKLRRFRKVLDRLRSKNARASYVYLDNVRRPDRVTVRLR